MHQPAKDKRLTGRRADRGRQRGIALIAVLWLVLLLSLMAASFLSQTGTDVRLTANLRGAAEAEAAADGAIHQVIWAALNGLTPEEAGLTPQPLESDSALPDSLRYATQVGGTPVSLLIEVEGYKLDINLAEEEGFIELMLALGLQQPLAERLTDAILDFRDGDQERRILGAEDPDYLAAGRPWGAKDTRFGALEELQQVLGVTPEIYDRLRPYVSVASGGERVAEDLLARLTGAPLSNLGAEAADEQEQGAEPDGQGILPAGRLIYSMKATAATERGGRFQRHAVVRISGRRNDYGFLEWRQGYVSARD